MNDWTKQWRDKMHQMGDHELVRFILSYPDRKGLKTTRNGKLPKYDCMDIINYVREGWEMNPYLSISDNRRGALIFGFLECADESLLREHDKNFSQDPVKSPEKTETSGYVRRTRRRFPKDPLPEPVTEEWLRFKTYNKTVWYRTREKPVNNGRVFSMDEKGLVCVVPYTPDQNHKPIDLSNGFDIVPIHDIYRYEKDLVTANRELDSFKGAVENIKKPGELTQ